MNKDDRGLLSDAMSEWLGFNEFYQFSKHLIWEIKTVLFRFQSFRKHNFFFLKHRPLCYSCIQNAFVLQSEEHPVLWAEFLYKPSIIHILKLKPLIKLPMLEQEIEPLVWWE